MRITSAGLNLAALLFMLCLFLFIPPALADDADEQAKYDQVIKLLYEWRGHGNNREQALEIARTMMQKNPKSAMAYTAMGWATWWIGYIDEDHHDQDKLREAQGYFRKALELDPSFEDSEYYLAGSYVTAGEYDKALSIAEKFQKDHPDLPASYHIHILVAYKKREHKTLLKLGLDLKSKFPNDKYTSEFVDSRLVTAYTALGQLDKAEELHLKLIEEAPNEALFIGNYATFLSYNKEDHDKAIEYAEKALAIMDYEGARHALVHSAMSKCQQVFEQDKIEEAERYCLMALKQEPNLKLAWVALTVINYDLAKKNNDLEQMEKALTASKNAQGYGEQILRNWANIVKQIKADLQKMRNEAKKKKGNKGLKRLRIPLS